MPGKGHLKDRARRREEAARRARLVRLARRVHPVLESLRRLREAQGVGAEAVLAAVDLLAAEAALREVAEALAMEAGVTEAEWAAAVVLATEGEK